MGRYYARSVARANDGVPGGRRGLRVKRPPERLRLRRMTQRPAQVQRVLPGQVRLGVALAATKCRARNQVGGERVVVAALLPPARMADVSAVGDPVLAEPPVGLG